MQCPNCQHWNEAGSRFCEECGTELPTTGAARVEVPVRTSAVPPPTIPEPPPQQLIPASEAAPMPYKGPHLVMNATGSIFKLGSAAVLGREDATLQIDFDGYPDGQYISHRHAQFVMLNGRFYIEDLGSANHTYVNNIKLAQGQSEPVDDGDVIRLGKIELTFHSE